MRKGELIRRVRGILERYPETRESDHRLYIKLAQEVVGINEELPFEYVFINYKKVGLNGFESVSRARRKLQQIDKDREEYKIQSSKQMQKIRKEQERKYNQLYSANYKFAEERWINE